MELAGKVKENSKRFDRYIMSKRGLWKEEFPLMIGFAVFVLKHKRWGNIK